MTLDDNSIPAHERSTHQAIAAREQYELYNWWMNIRPNRPDPYVSSGWSELLDARRCRGIRTFSDHLLTIEEKNYESMTHQKLKELEEQYEQEDNDMLTKLISIRRTLWT